MKLANATKIDRKSGGTWGTHLPRLRSQVGSGVEIGGSFSIFSGQGDGCERRIGRKMAAESTRTKALDPLELTIEIRVVAEANLKAYFKHALVGLDQ
jgi:hypothetical protein